MIGALLAEELYVPYLSFVSRIEIQAGTVVARRIVEDGYEMIEAALPVTASVISDDTNVPRYSKLKDIMAAARKTVAVWRAGDLGVDLARVGSASRRLQVRDVTPVQRDSRCELVTGESPVEQAERLALRLRERKVI
jgi:electron transfer flavoprotein beta subunit